MDEWLRQRAIYLDHACSEIAAKGFVTLFLNRTNRSGIWRGGVIGGLNQDGAYKLDCRFNRRDLAKQSTMSLP